MSLLPQDFLAAGRLWLLLAVAALVTAYVLVARRRASYAVRFTDLDLLASVAPRRPGWRRHVPAGLLVLALAALVVAVARPVGLVDVPRERATVVVALDTSLSMQATDVAPDRDAAARAAATDFVEGLPERYNVALVSFSGVARLVVPPTMDHAAVARAVQDLSLGEGTAIGEAVFASLSAVDLVPADGAGGAVPARVVLLSDGTNTVGRDVAAAVGAARGAGVPVSTIAFGTQQGEVLIEGTVVPVPVDVPALRALATGTGGQAYRAESASDLSDVYDDIGSSVGTTVEEREVTASWTGAGLAAALLAAGLGLLWGTRFP